MRAAVAVCVGEGRDLLLADISAEAMRVVLCYLYTDQLVPDSGGGIQCVDWSEAIELANRLCLDRLISLIEHEVVHSLTTRHTHSEGVKVRVAATHFGTKRTIIFGPCHLFAPEF